ncbi:hypothetical protein [Bifidobacterium eulemuris]|uniref:hypothetical protein n=1 Tax=Bifidobacterium eulemuris TaxID=1765219 RepID=UPI001B800E41|nr:hypothetical protein [Bifidobacterium eulemuris]
MNGVWHADDGGLLFQIGEEFRLVPVHIIHKIEEVAALFRYASDVEIGSAMRVDMTQAT